MINVLFVDEISDTILNPYQYDIIIRVATNVEIDVIENMCCFVHMPEYRYINFYDNNDSTVQFPMKTIHVQKSIYLFNFV